MNKIMLLLITFMTGIIFCVNITAEDNSDDFFKIQAINCVPNPPKKEPAPYREIVKEDSKKEKIFLPYLEVTVRTQLQTPSLNMSMMAYFYDKNKKSISTPAKPHPVNRGGGLSPFPAFFPKGKDVMLYFVIPDDVLALQSWYAVIVFGDKNEVAATVYPRGNLTPKAFSFPEKTVYEKPAKTTRETVVNPLIEYIVKTPLKDYPYFTLFLRCPIGAKDFSDTKGVLAICVLSNGVEDIKKRLQQAEVKDELSGPLRFAEKHNLAIICWGARRLWNPKANWDEMKKQDEMKMDQRFDIVAQAWANGINDLARKYRFPNNNFLLWGSCGSAQYSARLALRQPKYFLAVRVHMPGSFDAPTEDGNRILWCLTTGEDEGGYDRTLKFLKASQKMGYPIVYKAMPGLGHATHPLTEKLGLEFFEYALTVREERDKFLDEVSQSFSEIGREWAKNPYQPWPVSFRKPEYVGDVYRQEIYLSDKIPSDPGIRIPLPTKKLADTWKGDE